MPSNCEICCEIVIAILLPPLGVCFRHGCCSVEFWICLLLTILGYVPGIIYALYAIIFIDRDEYFDEYRRPLYAPVYHLLPRTTNDGRGMQLLVILCFSLFPILLFSVICFQGV